MTDPIHVIVADDHPLFREGVIDSLGVAADLQVVGQADNAQDAVRLLRDELPDIALLDVTMPGGGGIEAARRIATSC